MKKTIQVQFKIGDEVRLKSDPSFKRIVTGYNVRKKQVNYIIVSGVEETLHQDIEIELFHDKKNNKTGFV